MPDDAQGIGQRWQRDWPKAPRQDPAVLTQDPLIYTLLPPNVIYASSTSSPFSTPPPHPLTAKLPSYLQRVLDSLPSSGQIPKTDDSTIHVVSDKVQRSNIVAVSTRLAL
ncbi:hypothetical protein F4604DRAFT_1956634 [Suillus subluteus]|nr:hypothetical protein F4604DRAFT_1956634 [Suillus subluteus]